MDTRDQSSDHYYDTEQENYNEAHCSLGHVVNLRNPLSFHHMYMLFNNGTV